MNLTWLFVGVVYALAVWLARRARADLPKRVALLFYALVLLFLLRPLTGQGVIYPADMVRLLSPWSEIRAPGRAPVDKFQISNLNIHDLPMQVIPWTHQVRESWRRLDVPLWNSSAGCGYPLLANGQSTPFSPLHLVTLPLGLGNANTAEAALKLLAALSFTWLFCRTRYSPWASLLAALAYGFSTWMTVWLQFPIAAAAAMLPAVLLAIERLIERQSFARVVGATAVFAVTVLSGHPETVFHVSLVAAAFGGWIALIEKRAGWRGLAAVVLASLLAALICAPFLAPFAEAVTRSQRFAEASAPKTELRPPWSDRPSAMLLLQPRFFGELPIERPWGPVTLESICGFAGVLSLASCVAVAWMIVARRRWREREALHVLGVIVSTGIVLGWPWITEGFHAIAGLAPPMRMRLAICWFASVLVAAAVDWIRERSSAPLLAGAAAVALLMLGALRTAAFPSPAHIPTAVLSLLPSVAVLAAVTAFAFRRIPRAPLLALLSLLTVLELWAAIGHWNRLLPPREVYPRTPLIEALLQLKAAEREPFRIVGLNAQLYPNTGAMFGLEDVRVHDPMAWDRYVRWLERMAGWNPADYYAKWYDSETPLLDALNVKYVLAEQELSATRLQLVYAGRDGFIYRNPHVLPRFYAPEPARVTIVESSPTRWRLTVDAPDGTIVYSSIPNYPGWQIEGGRLIEVNSVFLGVTVAAGRHEIEVAYRPASFRLASLFSIATILGMAGVGWWGMRGRQ